MPPKSYRTGLTGGYGVDWDQNVYGRGFGGGGVCCGRKINEESKYHSGAGGGFTGAAQKSMKNILR